MGPLKISPSLTFDDILLIPGYTDFSRGDISIATRLTKNITLDSPFVSSPMDTVTESKMAIALALKGGIGIIHRNLTPLSQASQVKKVKEKGLLVGAAVGSSKGFEERVSLLVKANVDAVLVDSAHGHSISVIETIKYIKKCHPKLEVIGGSLATYEGAKALIQAGADGLRVGMGPGAICTTRVISGMGVPQITALMETVRAAREFGDIPVIADGGIKYSGDMVKALAVGASTVMMGSYFASALESPGKIHSLTRAQVPHRFQSILTKQNTYKFKEYRGMGSIAAMKKGAKIKSEDEFHGKSYYKDRVLVAEGVEGLVPIKGAVSDLIEQSVGGIKSGMYYVGARSIRELWENASFLQVTQASLKESHPHDIFITNAGENY